MLNVDFWGKCTKLAKGITPTDTQITVQSGDGSKFALDGDDHFYITFKNGGTREVAKVVARNGDIFTVQRGQDKTSAQGFPKDSCLCVEWNPSQLCEYVQSCVAKCTNITPQTFVVKCGTAIEINECGNIVNIDGSEKC